MRHFCQKIAENHGLLTLVDDDAGATIPDDANDGAEGSISLDSG